MDDDIHLLDLGSFSAWKTRQKVDALSVEQGSTQTLWHG